MLIYIFKTNKIYNILKPRMEYFFYIRNLILIFLIDFLIIDDEPLWEPLEWTLVQTWLLYIFFFTWIAETLVTAKYGSFTGRDKRVYMGLFKNYWFVELWFMFNLMIVGVFILVPFFFELNYSVSYINTWWDWLNSFFFFKIIFIFFIINILNNILNLSNRWLDWKFKLILVFSIILLFFYIFFFNFFLLFFSYFTDLLYYKKYGWSSYYQLSKGPFRWGWGEINRDFFTYHSTPANTWFKNNSMYASALLLFNLFFLLSLLFLIIQLLIIFRYLYTNKFISYTLINYFNSSISQFFLFILFIYFFVLVSYIYQFNRFPNELYFFSKYNFFFKNFSIICYNYFLFIINTFIK